MAVDPVCGARRIHVGPAAGDLERHLPDTQIFERIPHGHVDAFGQLAKLIQLVQVVLRLPAVACGGGGRPASQRGEFRNDLLVDAPVSVAPDLGPPHDGRKEPHRARFLDRGLFRSLHRPPPPLFYARRGYAAGARKGNRRCRQSISIDPVRGNVLQLRLLPAPLDRPVVTCSRSVREP